MTRSNAFRFAVLMGGSLMLAASGCNLLSFVSNDERIQVGAVRTLKNTLSPSSNKALGVFLRESANLLSFGIPSRFGVDVAPYLAAFPSVTIGRPTVTPAIDADQGTKELRRIYSGTQLLIESSVAQGAGQEAYVYTLNARQTPTGTNGQLVVTTSGTNWVPMPTAPGYVLNQGKGPRVPSSLNANLQLNLPQSAGQVKLQASLAQFEQGDNSPIPRDVSFGFSSANIAVQLTGSYSGAQVGTLSGATTLKGDKGNETYQTRVTASNGSLQVVLTNELHAFHVDLAYNNGLLTGTAKAADGRQLELAKITHTAGKMPDISYADGTKESWNFTLPPN